MAGRLIIYYMFCDYLMLIQKSKIRSHSRPHSLKTPAYKIVLGCKSRNFQDITVNYHSNKVIYLAVIKSCDRYL